MSGINFYTVGYMSWFLKGFKLSQVFLNIISTYKCLLKFLSANLTLIV